MQVWIKFVLFLIAQVLVFRLICIEYSKYAVKTYKLNHPPEKCPTDS